jgi:subtilisin
MSFRTASRVRRTGAVLVCGALLALATITGVGAQSQRTPGPPADTLVDVLITFRSLPGASDEALVRGLGGAVKYRYHLVPGIAASLPSQAVTALQGNPRVALVEPDGLFFAIEADYAGELGNAWGIGHIGAGEVHRTYGQTGGGVLVAVIDSGIDYTHPELLENYAFGHNFITGTLDAMDDNGHGTHVAGTVAAVRNGAGVVGVAPTAGLVGLKVLGANGSGSFSNVIAALQFVVENEIPITNNSYGSDRDPGTLVRTAFANSAAAGVLHIAAAGNSGNCGGNNNSVGFPAQYDSVVAVAAVNSSNKRPCFSSTGPTLELSAPGVSVNSTVPGGGYASWNGTSMASPHVAGVAALVKGFNAELTGVQIRQILRDTAQPLGITNHYGHGLVRAVQAVTTAGATEGGTGETSEETTAPGEGNPDLGTTIGMATVPSITYSSSGGRLGDKHLAVTVTVHGDGVPLGGASVSISITKGTSTASGTGTTGSGGTVTFTWSNAPSGCASTDVTALTAGGFQWHGGTPANNWCP